MLTTFLDLLSLAGLAMLSVALWTIRVALTAQRRKKAATGMAAFEATVFAIAFARLLTGIDNPLGIGAYAIGVATGTSLALLLDDVLNPEIVRVDIVDPSGQHSGPYSVSDTLRRNGWPTTTTTGEGLSGPVNVISITTGADRVPALTTLVSETDAGSDVFWTVSPVRESRAVDLPAGFSQAAAVDRRRRRPTRHR